MDTSKITGNPKVDEPQSSVGTQLGKKWGWGGIRFVQYSGDKLGRGQNFSQVGGGGRRKPSAKGNSGNRGGKKKKTD